MRTLFKKELAIGKFETINEKPKFDIIHVTQTHSNIILEYNGDKLEDLEADGIIIDPVKYPRCNLAIKTADCLPVLLIGKKVALIHAGWKGIQNRILTSKILKNLDISYALIGPSIRTYEVQENFRNEFPDSDSFFTHNGKLHFNLQNEAVSQLKAAFTNIEVEDSDQCTLLYEKYHSYRRNKTKKRNWNVFKLN